MPNLPSGTVTFLFSDIEGSTSLLKQLGDEQYAELLQTHRRIVREMPEVRLASLFTHEQPDQPWETGGISDINPVWFGQGHPAAEQSHPRWMMHDWRKGGRIPSGRPFPSSFSPSPQRGVPFSQ